MTNDEIRKMNRAWLKVKRSFRGLRQPAAAVARWQPAAGGGGCFLPDGASADSQWTRESQPAAAAGCVRHSGSRLRAVHGLRRAMCAVGMAAVMSGSLAAAPSARDLGVLLVIGAEGTPEYGKRYAEEAKQWQDACAKAALKCETIGLQAGQKDKPDAELLKAWLQSAAANPTRPLWLVLIGHGTFDGREAKFNLRGPDITAADLAGWLKPMTGEVAVIQTASASAPFLKALAGQNRVLISATKSADEVFYTRFGQFFAKAISGATEADLDRDQQVSLLEAFLWSSKQVTRFFETEGRLATEHALIEDNGDGTGTRAELFNGIQLASPPADGKTPEGRLARQWCLVLSDADAKLTEEQRKRRGALERDVEALKSRKAELGEAEFYGKLEALMLDIARIYEAAKS